MFSLKDVEKFKSSRGWAPPDTVVQEHFNKHNDVWKEKEREHEIQKYVIQRRERNKKEGLVVMKAKEG